MSWLQAIWLKLTDWRNMPSMSRAIVDREGTPNGEIVHLECGHRYQLIYQKRTSFLCPECAANWLVEKGQAKRP